MIAVFTILAQWFSEAPYTVCLLCTLLACSTGKVITYAHGSANFPHYQTYKIESHQKIAEVSPRGYATYQRLDESISQQMEAKGYRYHLQADLIVRYEVSSGLSQNTRRSYYNRFGLVLPGSQLLGAQ